MHEDPNHVAWAGWLRSRPDDIRHPDRVIVRLGDDWYCQLCSRRVTGQKTEHHVGHMIELDVYLAGLDDNRGPKPDSIRRADDRRRKRQEAIERSTALGEDPFIYTVAGVEPTTKHRIRQRRLRHPRAETLARIKDLQETGLMVDLIAKEMQVSEQYVRRLIKQTGGGRNDG
jgi:hypothetical protein